MLSFLLDSTEPPELARKLVSGANSFFYFFFFNCGPLDPVMDTVAIGLGVRAATLSRGQSILEGVKH